VFSDKKSQEAKAFFEAIGMGKLNAAHTFNAALGAEVGLKGPIVKVFKKVGK
jgi:hypothetical protein